MVVSLEPPDGGYGWIIVFASILNNFLMVPLIQNVVLIFKDKMLEIDMTITQMWFTLNFHASFGYIIHLVNNKLLEWFGYRKVTLVGVTFVFVGLSMSSWIHNYLGFMLTFGLVTAIGIGLNTSSYTLAIKSYFQHNQNKAIGLSMTLTALGPILMPQIINVLIQNYHPDGVILILAGIMSHGYVASVLLQPVKKHMIKVKKDVLVEEPTKTVEEEELEMEALDELMPQTYKQNPFFPPREFMSNRRFPGFRRKDSIISISYEQEHAAIMGLDSTLGGSLYSLDSGQRRSSSLVPQQRYLTKTTWWKSEESVNLESCYNIFDEEAGPSKEDKETKPAEDGNTEKAKEPKEKFVIKNGDGAVLDKHFHFEEPKVHKDHPNIRNLPWYKRWPYRAVEMFGLDIFLDLRYVNILIGLSLAILVEMNFTVLLPFVLFEYSLTISEIAAFLSVLGTADILFRFLAPLIGDCLKQPARIMIILVLAVIIAVRIALIYIRSYPLILLVAFVLGCIKGIRVTFMSLVLPSYVPESRLASASAIQIVFNSAMSLIVGHAIGVTRTKTGSYTYCLLLLNCLTALTIFMWSGDILYKKCQRKRVDTEQTGDMNVINASEVY